MLQDAIDQIKKTLEPLVVYLDDSDLDDAGAQLLAEALKEAQAPITLHLTHNNLGTAGIRSIAEAIKEALVPITLYLDKNNLGVAGAGLMADAIENVRFPFILDLSFNDIGSAGAELIAGAIIRAKVPLMLNLGSNDLKDDGIKLIADAIRQTKVKLSLYLHNNSIGDDGAGFIADAIKVALPSLFLDLGLNVIGDRGAEYLADAMIKAQFSLTLDLYWNNIGINGARVLAHALKHANTPVHLYLNCGVDPEVTIVLNEALADNFIVDARLDPPRFLTRLGFNLCKKLLAQIFYYSFMPALIQEYIGACDLAWIEVDAIKKIEGASYENKYSSINSAVLDAAYFNEPSEDQQLPELVEATQVAEPPQVEQFDTRLRLHFNSGRKRKLPDCKWIILKSRKVMEEDEDEQYINLANAEDNGSNSPSSISSSSSSYVSNCGFHLAMLSSKQATEANSLFRTTQSINHGQEQTLQEDNNNTVEQWLMDLFTWIKDLSLELQQQILSSFSRQQVLMLLQQTLHPHKVIDDQFSDKSIAEVFEKEYPDLYGLISTDVNAKYHTEGAISF